jgi:hypothetical protein
MKNRTVPIFFTLGETATVVDRAGDVGVGKIVSRTFEEKARYDLRMNNGAIIKEVTADQLRRCLTPPCVPEDTWR